MVKRSRPESRFFRSSGSRPGSKNGASPLAAIALQWSAHVHYRSERSASGSVGGLVLSGAVFNSLLGISWFWFLGALVLAQLPAYAKDYLGGAPAVVTLLLA